MSWVSAVGAFALSLPHLRWPSVPVDNVEEFIWAGSGAIFAAALVVSIDSIISQITAHRRRLDPGRSWEAATIAVRGLVKGDPQAAERFTEMLRGHRTREFVIDALTNEARHDPDVARCLRGRAADMDSIARLVTTALADSDAGRRAYACEVVAMLRLRSARGAVLAATTDSDATVRIAACRSLGVIDPDAAVGVLLGVLDTEGPWAAALLGDVVKRLSSAGQRALLRRAEDWGASPALVRLLADIPEGGANEVLIDALDDVDPSVRARSAEAIDPSLAESRDALVLLLTDKDEATRLSAVRALARGGHVSAALPLFSALNDVSRVVRMAAAAGIVEVPGGLGLLRRARLSSTEPLAAEAADLALWLAEGDDVSASATSSLGRSPDDLAHPVETTESSGDPVDRGASVPDEVTIGPADRAQPSQPELFDLRVRPLRELTRPRLPSPVGGVARSTQRAASMDEFTNGDPCFGADECGDECADECADENPLSNALFALRFGASVF